MPRASSTELVEVKLPQAQPYVKENLVCGGCGAKIITDGKLTCPRCHESVQIALSKNVVRDEEGRWKCQKCREYGKNPKTLAVGDEIQCRICPEKTKNKLFEEESEMSKAAKVETQEKSGPTKLTTKEYNELLQQWLKDEKKKKKQAIALVQPFYNTAEGIKAVEEERNRIDQRIEALERAIALNFDPDEFERITNVPLRCNIWPGSFWITFSGRIEEIRQRSRVGISKKRITKFDISPVYARSPNLTIRVFDT